MRNKDNVSHYETVRQCKDGRHVQVSLTVSPIKDATGKVVAASKIARDITDVREQISRLLIRAPHPRPLASEAQTESYARQLPGRNRSCVSKPCVLLPLGDG